MLGLLNLSVKHGILCDLAQDRGGKNRCVKVPVECGARHKTTIMAPLK